MRDTLLDGTRTMYWYSGLRAAQGVTSAYAMEKIFEPDSFGRPKSSLQYRHKWQRYARGEHTPQRRIIEIADAIVSGSAAEIEHPLWKLLRIDMRGLPCGNALLRELTSDLQQAVFDLSKVPHRVFARRRLTARLLNRIEQLAGLDALAALLILFWEAIEHSRHDDACTICKRIFRMLLILGPVFRERTVMFPIFELFSQRIFTRGGSRGLTFKMDNLNYSRCADLLHSVTPGYGSPWGRRVRAMQKVLNGLVGFEYRVTLAPTLLPLDPTQVSEDDLRWVRIHEGLRTWAWNAIDSATVGLTPPPDTIWNASESLTGTRERDQFRG
jgi:hypothetical protein